MYQHNAVRNLPLYLLVALIIAGTGAHCAPVAAAPLELDSNTRQWNLAPATSLLELSGGDMTIETVAQPPLSDAFTPLGSDTVNLGIQRSTYWFRFTVANARSERTTFYVELNNARIKQADFYVPGLEARERHQVSGTALPFGDRTLPYRKPVFRLTLDPGQAETVYLRVYHRGSYRFDILLWEYDAFISRHALETGAYGMFYGSLLIMFIFNMVLFALFRERSFFWLSIVIAATGLYMFVYQRLDVQHLWPNATEISGSRLNVLIAIGLSASFYFSRDLLRIPLHAPKLDRLYLVYGALSLLLCLDVIVEGTWSDWLMQAIGGTAPLVLIYGAAVRAMQGSRYAWGYMVTWGAMFASMIGFALLGAGILPQSLFLEHAPKVAFPLALSLNSVGIWQRFRELQDKYTADLEVQVKERTKELTLALDNVKTLRGLIPICSACKSIRDDEGFWIRVETYIQDHSDADFTHGICPDCAMRLYNKKISGGPAKKHPEP